MSLEEPDRSAAWNLQGTVNDIRQFNEARGWANFHNPKNLAMALAGEVGELSAEFQWLTHDEANQVMTTEAARAVEAEVADVAIYLLTLVDRLNINLPSAVAAKLERNEARFPAPDHRPQL